MFLLEENKENLGVNFIIFRGVRDNFGGGLAVKSFIGDTDVVAVFYVIISVGRAIGGFKVDTVVIGNAGGVGVIYILPLIAAGGGLF